MPSDSMLLESSDLARRLREASVASGALFAELIRTACIRLHGLPTAGTRIERLAGHDAYVDAAMALLACELPFWQIRRISYDSGEWHCALSRQRELPDWLDDAIESHHADLALAMLSAFLDARHIDEPARSSVPLVHPADPLFEPVNSDHFG